MDKKKLVAAVSTGVVASAVAGIVYVTGKKNKNKRNLGDSAINAGINAADAEDCWEVLQALREYVEDNDVELRVEEVILFPDGKVFDCTIDGMHRLVRMTPQGELAFGHFSTNEEE